MVYGAIGGIMKIYPRTLSHSEWQLLENKDDDTTYMVEDGNVVDKIISYCQDPFADNDYNPKSEYGIGRKNMAEEILELIGRELSVKLR